MGITDWDAWMKEHHVKIYTEEELKRKQRKETFEKVKRFMERHAVTRQKHDSK